MANSQVTASLTLSVQDLTVPGSQNIVNHIIPPLVFISPGPGGLGISYSGYYNLLPGGAINLVPGGVPITPFLFIRNVGPQACTLQVAFSRSPSDSSQMTLVPGQWFMYGCPGLDNTADNGLT